MNNLTIEDIFTQHVKHKKALDARTKAEKKEARERLVINEMLQETEIENILYHDKVTDKMFFFNGWNFTEVIQEKTK